MPGCSARQIMDLVDARDDGDNGIQDMEMILIDKNGNRRERTIRAMSRDVGEDTHTIMFFLSPADVKDTGFLTYDYDDDDQGRRSVALPAGAQEDQAHRLHRQERQLHGLRLQLRRHDRPQARQLRLHADEGDRRRRRPGLADRVDPEHREGDRRNRLHEVHRLRAQGQLRRDPRRRTGSRRESGSSTST